MGGNFSICIGAAAATLFNDGLFVGQADILMILFMGAFTIGLGIALVSIGTGYLPAAEVSLLVLIESVLGPAWPWLFLGESLTKSEIIGGCITLIALIILTITTRETKTKIRNLN
jgi:drug/metabolite transporter (DMT)-like permease